MARLDANIGEQFEQELGFADTGLAHDCQVGIGVPHRIVKLNDDAVLVQNLATDENIQPFTTRLPAAFKFHVFNQPDQKFGGILATFLKQLVQPNTAIINMVFDE